MKIRFLAFVSCLIFSICARAADSVVTITVIGTLKNQLIYLGPEGKPHGLFASCGFFHPSRLILTDDPDTPNSLLVGVHEFDADYNTKTDCNRVLMALASASGNKPVQVNLNLVTHQADLGSL